MWRRSLAVTHHNRSATLCHAEEQLRKIVGKTNATMAGGIAGKLTRMHRDAGPGKSLHVRHRRVVVLFGVVLLALLKNSENSARSFVTFRAGAYSRPPNQDS